jgi:hypothetical protein
MKRNEGTFLPHFIEVNPRYISFVVHIRFLYVIFLNISLNQHVNGGQKPAGPALAPTNGPGAGPKRRIRPSQPG